MRVRTEIDALAAPAEDKATLVWPSAESLPRLIEQNRRLRASFFFSLLDCPVGALLQADLEAAPIVMTGHQPAFLHPGVWAKSVSAAALARRHGGRAEFLVVDSDVPHGLSLQWPQIESDRLLVRSATLLEHHGGRSYEQLPAVSRERWQGFCDAIPPTWRLRSDTGLRSFLRGFQQRGCALGPSGLHDAAARAPQTDSHYVDQWINGLVAVDQALGIQSPRFVRVGSLFSHRSSSAGLLATAFTAHLLLNAGAFAQAYNVALADYRMRRGIRGDRHPVPDLISSAERVELPFWMARDGQPRQRLFVSRGPRGTVRLWAGSRPTCALDCVKLRRDATRELSNCLDGWQIRPRALALTMFARLFLCDLFIHGIGGAKYDQITDHVIRCFFGTEPPAYACVSATLRLPLAAYEVTEADLRRHLHRARDVRYNPQRHLAGVERSAQIQALLEDRERAIAESRRLQREAPRDRAARRAAFERIGRCNEAVHAAAPRLMEEAIADLDRIRRRLGHNRIARSREWFFALYRITELTELRDRLP